MIELFPIRILNDRLERLIRWLTFPMYLKDYDKAKECIPLHHENRPERPYDSQVRAEIFSRIFSLISTNCKNNRNYRSYCITI